MRRGNAAIVRLPSATGSKGLRSHIDLEEEVRLLREENVRLRELLNTPHALLDRGLRLLSGLQSPLVPLVAGAAAVAVLLAGTTPVVSVVTDGWRQTVQPSHSSAAQPSPPSVIRTAPVVAVMASRPASGPGASPAPTPSTSPTATSAAAATTVASGQAPVASRPAIPTPNAAPTATPLPSPTVSCPPAPVHLPPQACRGS
jgi:hypothetical protein